MRSTMTTVIVVLLAASVAAAARRRYPGRARYRENAGHGFRPTGGSITPTRKDISRLIAEFFDRQLKR